MAHIRFRCGGLHRDIRQENLASHSAPTGIDIVDSVSGSDC